MVYIAPAESNGEGDVWVKLYEDGLTDGKWAVDKFITDKGKVTITLPDLAAGEYLIRPEIIALHEASSEGAAQFYNGCGQIKVTGGSASLPAGVDMTKAYSATDPGVLFNIYSGATSYPIPGPKVWDGKSSSGSAPASSKAASAVAEATPVASSTAAASSAAVTSAAASSVASAVAEATPVASSSPSSGSDSSSSTLPEEFTIKEFIAWLKETTGATGASNARRHARSFFG